MIVHQSHLQKFSILPGITVCLIYYPYETVVLLWAVYRGLVGLGTKDRKDKTSESSSFKLYYVT